MSDYEVVIVSDDPKALRRFAISIRHDNDGDKAACRKLVERLADLIEAQEKAEPVYEVVLLNDHLKGLKGDIDLSDLPAGSKLYLEPPTMPTGVPKEQTYTWRSRHSENEDWIYHNGEWNLWENQKLLKQTTVVDKTAEQKLASSGVFAGVDGLRGLLESDAFWSVQPYGTRLHYGEGITEYLHRGVLRAAVELLDNKPPEQAPVVDEYQEQSAIVYLQDTTKVLGLNSGDDGLFYMTRALTDWIDQARAKLGQATDKACSIASDEFGQRAHDFFAGLDNGDGTFAFDPNDARDIDALVAAMLKGEK